MLGRLGADQRVVVFGLGVDAGGDPLARPGCESGQQAAPVMSSTISSPLLRVQRLTSLREVTAMSTWSTCKRSYCPSGQSQTTPRGGRVNSADWSKPCKPTSVARTGSALVVPTPPNRSASVLRSSRHGPPLGRPMR